MNPKTGEVYRDLEILRAIARGEPVVSVAPDVADAVEIGMDAMRRARGLPGNPSKPKSKQPKQFGATKPKSKKANRRARGRR